MRGRASARLLLLCLLASHGLWTSEAAARGSKVASSAAGKPTLTRELLQELRTQALKGGDGVIRFTDDMFKLLMRSTDRDFSLVVFLDAKQLHDKPALALPTLRKEFTLLNKAFLAGPDPDQAFLVDALFEEGPLLFKAVDKFTLPYIFRVDPSTKVGSKMEIPKSEAMQPDSVRAPYPWTAEVMAEHFSKTPKGMLQLQFGPVDRPSIFKSRWFPLMAGLALIGAGGIVAAVAMTIARHPAFWAVGAVGVAWFSTSGGMYNIIRGTPMFATDSAGKMLFFSGSRQGQLGAEGFIVGSGYVLFSLAAVLLTHGVPRVKSGVARAVLSYLLVVLCGFVGWQLWGVYLHKTKYTLPTYLT